MSSFNLAEHFGSSLAGRSACHLVHHAEDQQAPRPVAPKLAEQPRSPLQVYFSFKVVSFWILYESATMLTGP